MARIFLFFFMSCLSALEIDYRRMGRIDDILSEGIEKHIFPGAVCIIGNSKKVLWQRACGHHTYDLHSSPITVDKTLFDLSSLSKIVGTTMMTMSLIEAGKIKLSDYVYTYVPDFIEDGKELITIQNLLTHTSGLPPDAKPEDIQRLPQEHNNEAVLRYIIKLPLKAKPHEQVIYSCLNFYLLAYINELIASERQEDFLQRKIFNPLQMYETRYYLTDDKKTRCVPTAEGIKGVVHDPLARFYGVEHRTPGNAGMFSSGRDLTHFCSMIMNDGIYNDQLIFSSTLIREMLSCYTQSLNKRRALGFNILDEYPYSSLHMKDDNPETYIVGHTGYTGTMIWIDRLSKIYLILLTSRVYPDEQASVVSVREKIIKYLLKIVYKDGF